MNLRKVGISLIGLPGSGKTSIGKGLHLPGYHVHDMDNNGLENTVVGYGEGGVARLVQEIGDRAFLKREANFLMTHYGLMREGKFFSLENKVFSTSGSVVKVPESIEYLRERANIILIRSSESDEEEISIVLQNIRNRKDGASRIVGMNGGPNGEEPESKSLEEELWKRLELYKKYADHTFVHAYTRDKKERTLALQSYIESRGILTPQ